MKVLVLRFSAIGDVALLAPAFRQVLEANSELSITLLSKELMRPFFIDLPRVEFLSVDLTQYKGVVGLYRLAQVLKKQVEPDFYLDLHDSLRTRIIRLFFRLWGVPVYVLDKGRAEKKKLCRRKRKELKILLHAVQRYLLVFHRAGLYPDLKALPLQGDRGRTHAKAIYNARPGRSNALSIGFAPFAGFQLKELPQHKRTDLLQRILSSYPESILVLFGSSAQRGEIEEIKKQIWNFRDRVFFSLDLVSKQQKIGGLDQADTPEKPLLQQELKLIGQLDLMISMDSANMHLATLCGTKVIGIYGPTHPYLGFSPYGQEVSGSFGLEGLGCRPCTVYGKGKCYRGDFACMNELSIEALMARIEQKLNS